MTVKKRLLVTGAGGFLGWNICRLASNNYSVIGVCHTRPLDLDAVTTETCDLTRYRQLRELFPRTRPDAVIHAAAEPRPNVCQEFPEKTRAINVDASLSIAGLCSDSKIPCAYISTDLVFDGTAAPYNEEREPNPISVYGEQKLEAENGMRSRCGDLVVCRVPLMYGDAPRGAQSFIQPFIAAIVAGEELSLFTDEFRTPACGRAAARGILLALEKIRGTIHLGGSERISRYDFGKKLARALGKTDARIAPKRLYEVRSSPPRPPDVSLDSSKAFALGYDPKPINEELAALDCVKRIADTRE